MAATWSKAEPDSLVGRMTRDGRRTGALSIFFANLVWLFYMAIAPWFVPHPSAAIVVATYVSLALFLVFYQRAWFGARAHLPRYTIAIALMGLAIIPVNSSWSYIIYAGSLLPFWGRGWKLVARMTVLLVAFCVVAMASGFFSPLLLLSCVVTTIVIAIFNTTYEINSERDARLRLTQDEVRRLAIAAERERIGRDLHDLLGHTLSLVVIKTSLARRLLDSDPEAASHELADVERVARQSLAEVREAVTGMRAPALAGELASARLILESGNIRFDFEGSHAALQPAAEAALALGLREAVTNVHRHARATRVEVSLVSDDGATELSVRDNGRGGVKAQGNGLAGMAERLAAVGGRVSVTSEAGRGTLVELVVPNAAKAIA